MIFEIIGKVVAILSVLILVVLLIAINMPKVFDRFVLLLPFLNIDQKAKIIQVTTLARNLFLMSRLKDNSQNKLEKMAGFDFAIPRYFSNKGNGKTKFLLIFNQVKTALKNMTQ